MAVPTIKTINEYDIGDIVRLKVTFLNAIGNPADPTNIYLSVKKVDIQDVITPTIDRTGVGLYQSDVSIDTPGVWYYRWSGTGEVTAAEEGQFYVRYSKF